MNNSFFDCCGVGFQNSLGASFHVLPQWNVHKLIIHGSVRDMLKTVISLYRVTRFPSNYVLSLLDFLYTWQMQYIEEAYVIVVYHMINIYLL